MPLSTLPARLSPCPSRQSFLGCVMLWVPTEGHMTIALLGAPHNEYPRFWWKKLPLVDKDLAELGVSLQPCGTRTWGAVLTEHVVCTDEVTSIQQAFPQLRLGTPDCVRHGVVTCVGDAVLTPKCSYSAGRKGTCIRNQLWKLCL